MSQGANEMTASDSDRFRKCIPRGYLERLSLRAHIQTGLAQQCIHGLSSRTTCTTSGNDQDNTWILVHFRAAQSRSHVSVVTTADGRLRRHDSPASLVHFPTESLEQDGKCRIKYPFYSQKIRHGVVKHEARLCLIPLFSTSTFLIWLVP